MDWIISSDQQLLLLINGMHASWADHFMLCVTKTATWIPLWVALLFLMSRKLHNIRLLIATLVAVVLLVTITDQFASGFCKGFFCRLRPSHEPTLDTLVHVVNGYCGGLYGFISSHAANTFGVAMFLSLFFRHCGITVVLFLWAALCSYSRMYLGLHYPGDILCGALFGLFAGYIIFRLYKYLITRYVRIFSR